MEIKYESSIPDKDEFFQLYETTGWNANGTYVKESVKQENRG